MPPAPNPVRCADAPVVSPSHLDPVAVNRSPASNRAEPAATSVRSSSHLVALGSAAVIAVYGAGYMRTREAAAADEMAERRPAYVAPEPGAPPAATTAHVDQPSAPSAAVSSHGAAA